MFHSYSAPESLGSVWGVHIWHDNSGPSPEWYLREVAVSEVSGASCWRAFAPSVWRTVAHSTARLARQVRRSGRGRGRAWPFDARCWLAASEGDGQVERVLRVCAEAPGFSQVEMLTQHTNKKNKNKTNGNFSGLIVIWKLL